MAMTPEHCQCLVEGEDIKALTNVEHMMPRTVFNHRDAVMLPLIGVFGSYVGFVETDLDGRFLRLGTLGYAFCPADSTHLLPVLRLVGELNYSLCGIKFGWDPADGEINGFVEAAVEDGAFTQAQFHSMVGMFLIRLDISCHRISRVIETGHDPGETTSRSLLNVLGQSDSLPSALRWHLNWVLEDLQSDESNGNAEQEGAGD